MPSTYAHRRFGADVLERLPAELQEKIAPYRELYDIGLHGPDLLFYYHAAKSNPVPLLSSWTNYFNKLNKYEKQLADVYGCTYVAVPFAQTELDGHPTVAGHKYIARKIVRAIEANQ